MDSSESGHDDPPSPSEADHHAQEAADEASPGLQLEEVENAYVVLYRRHLKETNAHLLGKEPFAPMHPSFYPPLGHWTAAEKNAFFHALAVHSRLRPDLIAVSIGPTKSAMDVCIYLDELHRASVRELRDDTRAKHPIAPEVSEAWLEYEERNVQLLVEAEDQWEETNIQSARKDEIRKQRRLLRQLSRCPPSEPDIDETARMYAIPNTETEETIQTPRDTWKPVLRKWVHSQQPIWRKEDTLRSLSAVHLRVLDWMIRDDLEVFPKHEDLAPTNTLKETSAFMAQNMPVFVDPSSSSQVAAPRTPPLPPPPSYEHAQKVNEASDNISLDDLSPASKRRYKKRLSERRRAARKLGKSDAEISLEFLRLKPGRKTNKKELMARERALQEAAQVALDTPANASSSSTPVTAPVQVTEDEYPIAKTDDGRTLEDFHSSIGGTTLPYKTLAMLKNTGFDIHSLKQKGLDLFNHSAMGKLMALYDRTYSDVLEAPPNVALDTLVLLRAHLGLYITQLVHRAIVIKEYEAVSKTRTKAWRIANDVISIADVQLAVESLGGKQNRNSFLATLADDLCQREDIPEDPTSSSMDAVADAAASEAEQDEDEVVDTKKSPNLIVPPVSQDVHAPHIDLFSIGVVNSDVLDDGIYNTTQKDRESDVLDLHSETMEALLQRELDEEMELDEQDALQGQAHERMLWKLVEDLRQGRKIDEDDEDGDEERRQRKAARRQERDLQRGYKSEMYVFDSD